MNSPMPHYRAGVLHACALLLLIGAACQDEEPTRSRSTEICAVLRDPDNDSLTAGDIADAADISVGALRQYVAERCPELTPRVN